jgi:hypothetical protein
MPRYKSQRREIRATQRVEEFVEAEQRWLGRGLSHGLEVANGVGG